MANLEDCLAHARELSPSDQARLVAELARDVLIRRLKELDGKTEAMLPLAEDEIQRIVHEARRETLRARGL